ncbi:MAG TPA: Stp1/IreP family PP2C-type Ser/Thr phosphatase [Candidatus Lachnoclostridium stercorigallinarum]|uniref:Stp1/IreP family PP2C-type Ser/Thr phosphatase n=1 Tax=Candidatus Lachnoclostridium stercorigallinarum TaxID=2838634 RepID=A0A9D2K6D9_9FIRM|nr:Stp1/IreP family PP2C-type Ser/Thr phosphatase [Candidatus Lachnoclostridium stercorigallinarum]
MESYALTDIGMVRNMNQDFVFASSERVGPLENLFLVADGMGGHRAGDYASRFLVQHLVSCIRQSEGKAPVAVLEKAIRQVNRELYREAVEKEELSGMGTTLVAASTDGSTLYVSNIGDSRLYLVRDGKAYQVTRDHSYVEEMVAAGRMVRGSEEYLSQKNIITRAAGMTERVEADFFEVDLEDGDRILLCSDGLTNMVSNGTIGEISSQEISLRERVEALVRRANENGGRDNITVILADYKEEVG